MLTMPNVHSQCASREFLDRPNTLSTTPEHYGVSAKRAAFTLRTAHTGCQVALTDGLLIVT